MAKTPLLQAAAWESAQAGRHTVIVTPTASGKTLCYNLPVVSALLADPGARALYLFPTKALAHDQLAKLRALGERFGLDGIDGYDGDTPPSVRRTLRDHGHVLLTNPWMLHAGILPNHTKWQGLFSALRYVVIDEVHTLSGVYGSHVANVLRRLRRICAHYGSEPTFCAASATISATPRAISRATALNAPTRSTQRARASTCATPGAAQWQSFAAPT